MTLSTAACGQSNRIAHNTSTQQKGTTVTDPTQLDNTVKRYLELDAMKADIEIEQASLKAWLRELGTGAYVAPCGVKVSVTPNRRFNADKALEVIPSALLPLCQKTVIDSARAKAALPPAIYETAMIEVGEPRVLVK